MIAVVLIDRQEPVRFLGCRYHLINFGHTWGQWFFNDDMLACLQSHECLLSVKLTWRGDNQKVTISLRKCFKGGKSLSAKNRMRFVAPRFTWVHHRRYSEMFREFAKCFSVHIPAAAAQTSNAYLNNLCHQARSQAARMNCALSRKASRLGSA